jgi:hypothetical protein
MKRLISLACVGKEKNIMAPGHILNYGKTILEELILCAISGFDGQALHALGRLTDKSQSSNQIKLKRNPYRSIALPIRLIA